MLGFDWDGNGVEDLLNDMITIDMLTEDEEDKEKDDEQERDI